MVDSRLTSLALDFATDHPRYALTVLAWNVRRIAGLAGRQRWQVEAARADISPRSAGAAMLCAWAVMLLAAAASRPAWPAKHCVRSRSRPRVSTLLVNAETPRFRAPARAVPARAGPRGASPGQPAQKQYRRAAHRLAEITGRLGEHDAQRDPRDQRAGAEAEEARTRSACRRAPEPLLPLSLFRHPIFAVTTSASLIIGALLFGVTIYVPVFVQGVLGQSATHSGVVLIPLSVGWVASSFVAGQLVARTGRYRIFPIVGTTLVLAGVLALASIDTGTSSATVAGVLVVMGLGMGVTWPIYVVATQNAVDPADLGVATSTLQFFRTMGGSLAVAALGALLTSRLAAELPLHGGRSAAAGIDTNDLIQGGGRQLQSPLQGGIEAALSASLHLVFLVLVPLAAVGVALALGLEERPLRRPRPHAEPTAETA